MSKMKLIIENWRNFALKEQEEPIETYGDLKNQLQTAIRTKKKEALKGFGIGLVLDAIGVAPFKDALTFMKTMYKLPDNKKTNTVLDVFLNVDDDVSAIIDDNLENAFLQDFIGIIEKKPNEEKIDASITVELQKYIAGKYNNKTVKENNS
tara:strand:+ start:2001 stop:2453 length:453 start_codon:yes stop_codon:yes gene_type:complete